MQLRIGERDSATGLYYVIYPDGSKLLNGMKIFNAAHQLGDVVLATRRSDGMMILEGVKVSGSSDGGRIDRDVGVEEFGSKPIGYLNGQVFNNEEEIAQKALWRYTANGDSFLPTAIDTPTGAAIYVDEVILYRNAVVTDRLVSNQKEINVRIEVPATNVSATIVYANSSPITTLNPYISLNGYSFTFDFLITSNLVLRKPIKHNAIENTAPWEYRILGRDTISNSTTGLISTFGIKSVGASILVRGAQNAANSSGYAELFADRLNIIKTPFDDSSDFPPLKFWYRPIPLPSFTFRSKISF